MTVPILQLTAKHKPDAYTRLSEKTRSCPCCISYLLVSILCIYCFICVFLVVVSTFSLTTLSTILDKVNVDDLVSTLTGNNASHSIIKHTRLESEKVISCYYDTPSDTGKELLPSGINPFLCTHINVAFARIVNKTIHLEPIQINAIQELTKLKKLNPDLKILLSIGGAGNDSGYSEMVINHASRKIFIKSIKYTLRNLTLDGVDLDWEFPAVHSNGLQIRGKNNRERQHFSQLLREIRAEYMREKRNYLLTVAAAAPQIIIDASYDVDQLNMYTDYVNIMTYDFHFYSTTTPFTGLNAPLFPRDEERLYLSTLNVNYTVHTYIKKGLDRDKIVVGIPTYGHSFQLRNSDNPTIGSPCSGYGSLGSLGFVEYPKICQYIQKFQDITIKETNDSKVPYLYRYHEWVSYDTPQSVVEKAKYIKQNNLRGAMIYSLNSDDYEGVCERGGSEKFPLSHSIKSTLVN